MVTKTRSTIWIVEDEPEICCLFADLLIDFDSFHLVCVDDARLVQAKAGDVIFLDMRGTRAQHLHSNGAAVITMSGDETLQPTLLKPFGIDQIETLLRNHIRQPVAA